ncbi:MAG: peptidoglycan DD-metalloendopeptidase family protein [Lachnospiraceae bacterium]|nr:peptidoglycan DD-metalloendopeptidase family protein [Lachnospiraceae bacterium]
MTNVGRKMGWRLKLTAVLMIVVLSVGLVAAASEIQGNKDKLDDVQTNIDRIEAERKETEKKLAELKEKQKDAEEYIAAVEAEIRAVIDEVAVMTEEKFAVMQQIERVTEELRAAEAEAEEQYEKMKLRIRYMYERGDTEYLELLFSAKSFTDFLSKTEYISQISEYDRTMLNRYQETIVQIEDAKEVLLTQKTELEAWEVELKAKESALVLLADAKADELKDLEDLIEDTDHLIVDYDQAMAEEEKALLEIQKEIERLEEEERKRIEEEKKRQEEEEKKRQEEEQKRQEEENRNNQNNQSGSDKEDAEKPTAPAPEPEKPDTGTSDQEVSDKGMIWPVASCTRITSLFGYRVDPITGAVNGTLSNHKGIDIALPYGALEGAPVSAAAAGMVVISRYSESAGNWVILYHGNSTYTVYMHFSKRNVTEGQWVSQGQTIGLVGNTGWSTGAHLHFEVRVGGFINSSFSVDPLQYVAP